MSGRLAEGWRFSGCDALGLTPCDSGKGTGTTSSVYWLTTGREPAGPSGSCSSEQSDSARLEVRGSEEALGKLERQASSGSERG